MTMIYYSHYMSLYWLENAENAENAENVNDDDHLRWVWSLGFYNGFTLLLPMKRSQSGEVDMNIRYWQSKGKGSPKSKARHAWNNVSHSDLRAEMHLPCNCRWWCLEYDLRRNVLPAHTGTASTTSKKKARNPGPLKTAWSYPPRKCLAHSQCMFITVCDQGFWWFL